MASKYLDRVNEIVNRTPGKAIRIKTVDEASRYVDKEKFGSVIKKTFEDLKEWFQNQGVSEFSKRTRVYYHPDDNVISISINGFYNKDGKNLDHTINRKIGANGSNYQEYSSTTVNQSSCDDFSPEMDMKMMLGDVKIPSIASTPFPTEIAKNPLEDLRDEDPFSKILRT